MHTRIISFYIAISLTGCAPALPTENSEDNRLKFLAPISETLKITDVAFFNSQEHRQGNIYGPELEGHLQMTLKSRGSSNVSKVHFNASWNVIDSDGQVYAEFERSYKGTFNDAEYSLKLPLRGQLSPGNYLLTVRLFETTHKQAVGYTHEIIIDE